MCKVAGTTKINNKNRDLVWIFMQHLGQVMSAGNNDGLGYAAFDKSGNLFGERWLINKTAFTDLSNVKGINSNKMNKIYSFFGDKVVRNEAQAIILHTRFATCGKGIENTHPFVDNIDKPNTAIIHNGIIANDMMFEKKYSTCDSEVLAHLYEKADVRSSLKHLDKFTTKLDGWYTVLNLSKTASGRMIMDLYTDNGRLCSYYIPELDTRIYASDARDIETTAKFFDLTTKDFRILKSETALRLDALTGEVLDSCKIEMPPVNPFPFLKIGGGNVVHEHGNFDDESFTTRWFNRSRE